VDEIARLIEQFRADGLPVVVAGPASEAAIRELEAACGHHLPPSYRAFLARFGGLAVDDARVSGISGGRIDGAPGRAWHDTRFLRDRSNLPADVLVIESGASHPACLDFARRRFDGECPVARFDPRAGVDMLTDPSFAVWLPMWLRAEADAREL
jgi:antitoxin YobK